MKISVASAGVAAALLLALASPGPTAEPTSAIIPANRAHETHAEYIPLEAVPADATTTVKTTATVKTASPQDTNPDPEGAKLHPGVAITTSDSAGRGYLHTRNGHIWAVTAAHVVTGHKIVKVNGYSFPVHSRHPGPDVAFIHLSPGSSRPEGFHDDFRNSPAPRLRQAGRKRADHYPLLGCPLPNTEYLTVSGAATRPGQSGSPVTNAAGDRMLGILVCGIPEKYRFIVSPASEYEKLIPELP